MKKLLLFISTMLLFSIALLAPISINAATCSCGNKFCVYNKKTESGAKKVLKKYVKIYLQKGRYKDFEVKFIRTRDLTYNKLIKRKRDKIIYIEVSTGYITNNLFDGIMSDGYYIGYSYVDDSLKKGTCLRSYFIYNPATTYCDDIIYRSDRVINTKKNIKAIRKAKKKFKKNFGYSYDEI